jgi:hypothetical protein
MHIKLAFVLVAMACFLAVNAQNDNPKSNNFMDMFEQFMESQSNVKFEDTYTFTQKVKMKFTDTNKGKSKTNYSSYYVGKEALMMDIVDENSNIIIDTKNKSMVTLDEKNKKATALSTAFTDNMVKNYMNKQNIESAKESNIKVSKLGNSRVILGYTCQEYLITDADRKYETRMWVSDSQVMSFMDIIGQNAASLKIKPPAKYQGITGSVLASSGKDLNTGDGFEMEVIEISNATSTKSISDYTMESIMKAQE